MLLTAGLGTRLRPVTDLLAKPAVPFLGTPLMFYPAHLLREVGVKDITVNVHWKPAQVENLTKTLNAQGLRTHVSPETCSPLGSGGGIWKARTYLDGADFWVCNGDEVILPRQSQTLERVQAEHLKHSSLATIALMRHPLVGTQFGGVWCDAGKNVLGFGKDRSKFPAATDGFHYIGILLLSPRIFNYLPAGESNILYDAIAAGIAKGESVRAVVDDYTWYETGNPKDFLHATGDALELFENGAGVDAETLRSILKSFNGTDYEFTKSSNCAAVYKHRTAYVASDAILNGFVVLEKGSRIEAGAEIKNCVLMPGAVAQPGEKKKDEILLPVIPS